MVSKSSDAIVSDLRIELKICVRLTEIFFATRTGLANRDEVDEDAELIGFAGEDEPIGCR
jgi:hypothetical protein